MSAAGEGSRPVLFVGDSITENWGRVSGRFFSDQGFLVSGVGGQTSGQILRRFRRDVLSRHPSVMVLLAGTNDLAENQGPINLETVVDHCATMGDWATSLGIRVVLASVLPASGFPWRPSLRPAEAIVALNQRLKALATQHGWVYLDYHGAMANEAGGLREGLSEDGVHPNAKGYALMEPLVLQALDSCGNLPLQVAQLERRAIASGYLSPDKWENNLRLDFFEAHYGVDFRLQINRVRSGYTSVSTPLPPGAKCRICRENEGSPGRETLEILPFDLGPHRPFFFQWTPFPLFPGHGVVVQKAHEPMRMDNQSLLDGAAFLRQAPGYTWLSNSDREGTGASILDHLHYQVGRGLALPVMQATVLEQVLQDGVEISLLHYPLAAVRFTAPDLAPLLPLATSWIAAWKRRDAAHHSLNLVWRYLPGATGGGTELTLLFRSSLCRTPEPLKRYKTEGVGVVEAAGEFVFPVPTGPDAEAIEREILTEGRRIIRDFLQGLCPWKEDKRALFHALREE